MFEEHERRYLAAARVGHLATADEQGRPHVVPVCFALVGDDVVTPLDEKPQAAPPGGLRRARDVRANPKVALVVDHYVEEWSRLGWLQVRGTATVLDPDGTGPADDAVPDEADHEEAITALREKYSQYRAHALEERPVIWIRPGSVLSWGEVNPADPET